MHLDPAPSRPMPDHDAWPAFALPWDDATPGPTDMSALLHRPAGARGFIRVAEGHLATGDGARWRIWGQNLCFNAPLPPMEMTPAIARRLAKFGINCIRLHHMDHPWPRGVLRRRLTPGVPEDTRALDPEAMARLDYFLYCCREQGVYIDLNLNVSRAFTAADGVKQAECLGYGKALTYFDPQLILLQKEYAAQMLGHMNSFTGNRYAEEPAIAVVEIVNENSLLASWVAGRLRGEQTQPGGTWCDIPPAYAEDLDRLWNAWLAGHYATPAALREAWAGDLREGEDARAGSVRRLRPEEFAAASAGRFRDEAAFYAEIEERFFREMGDTLRGELGVKQVILGTSDHNHSTHGALHVRSNAVLDAIDGHCYWQHPRFLGRAWSRSEWMTTNTPMVDQPDHSAPAQLSRSVVRGMPYVASEINEPFPNDYASEYLPVLGAYALLQDWDGLFFFAYGGGSEERWKTANVNSYFDMGQDPVKMAQTAAGALVFLRGDVHAAEKLVERRITREALLETPRQRPNDRCPYEIPGLPGRLALTHRTALADLAAGAVAPAPDAVALPEGHITSDTGELTWEDTPGDGRVVVSAPRYQAVIGRAGERAAGNLRVALETPFAAVELVSLEDAPIAAAGQMLLVAAARVANTGMRWTDDTRRSLGEQWGQAPTRIEPVRATITLEGLAPADTVLLKPLDERGQPSGEARPFTRDGAAWRVDLPEEAGTLWYLVEAGRG